MWKLVTWKASLHPPSKCVNGLRIFIESFYYHPSLFHLRQGFPAFGVTTCPSITCQWWTCAGIFLESRPVTFRQILTEVQNITSRETLTSSNERDGCQEWETGRSRNNWKQFGFVWIIMRKSFLWGTWNSEKNTADIQKIRLRMCLGPRNSV